MRWYDIVYGVVYGMLWYGMLWHGTIYDMEYDYGMTWCEVE